MFIDIGWYRYSRYRYPKTQFFMDVQVWPGLTTFCELRRLRFSRGVGAVGDHVFIRRLDQLEVLGGCAHDTIVEVHAIDLSWWHFLHRLFIGFTVNLRLVHVDFWVSYGFLWKIEKANDKPHFKGWKFEVVSNRSEKESWTGWTCKRQDVVHVE